MEGSPASFYDHMQNIRKDKVDSERPALRKHEIPCRHGDQGVEKGEQDADQEEKEKDMALHGLIQ